MADDTDPSAHTRRLTLPLLLSGALVVLLLALPSLAHFYTDYLWFGAAGRDDVFSTILTTRLGLGFGVGLAVALVLYVNARLAARLSSNLPTLHLADPNLASVDLGHYGPRALRFLPILVGILTGVAASSDWEAWLELTHGTSFGRKDPIFGRDIGFYVFELPIYDGLHTLLSWTVILSLILAGATYLLRGGLVWTGRGVQADRRARVHLSVLLACLFGLFAYDAWLEQALLLYSKQGPVAGASYTDVHARLPLLRIELVAAAVGAALILVSVTRQRMVLLGAAVAIYVGTEILGGIYPSIVQKFTVEPNEAVKEAPFIRHNIEASRAAYGLDEVKERDLSGDVELTLDDVRDNRATVENIRVWDHKPLLDTFAQIQEIRTYYEFASVDNDRYEVDGETRQIMLSPRELSASSLPNRTWINEHFTFTHGYGLTLGPVNQATEEGLPVLYIKDIPPDSSVGGLKVEEPAIYFGELSNDYVFVRTENREFDHPSGEENIYADYEGDAGVRLDSALVRSAMALRFGSAKILLSDDLTDDSRVLLYRRIRDRAARLAPFLQLDGDPYMVLQDDGTLTWIVDAYTTTGLYPYAQPARRNLNYMRNSVKVTIDAYDGRVTYYVADDEDPVLRTWRAIFPNMFQPLSELPADLRRHLRHPEDLFRIQTEMFSTYHMDSAELVYNREDQWEIPVVSRGGSSEQLEPYYTIMRLPGEEEAEFIFMLPFTPKRKENLAAWMVARNDGDRLGELVVYRFPRDRLVFGPSQIMNRISQDAEISRQVSLWDQRGSQAIFGTLLVIPIEESLIYVSPLYLRSQGGSIPELKRVIVAYGNDIAMEPTLDEALAAVFESADDEATDTPTTDRAPAQTALEGAATAEAAQGERAGRSERAAPGDAVAKRTPTGDLPDDPRRRAHALYRRAVDAQRRGDWAAYGAELEALERVLADMAADARGATREQPEPSPEAAQATP